VANPRIVTLVADTDTPITLDQNFGAVEVALIANAATTLFNARGAAIASSTPGDGHHVLTVTLPAKVVPDETGGQATVVHLRSSGTPTLLVAGL
jgi:hypothetical protein